MKTLLSFAALMFSVAAADPATTRTWTDDTGKFTIEAELEELRDDQVVLKRADGTRITVRMERLSTSDRRYLASLAISGRDATEASRQPRADEHLAGQAKVPTRLGQEPAGCNFHETRLDEAIESLAKQHRVAIRFDQESLSNERISLDRPLTLSLPPVSLESTLNLLLRQLHLTWTVREDSLVIISIHDEENYLLPITYNIADLRMALGNDIDTLRGVVYSCIDASTWDSVGGPASIELGQQAAALQIRQTFKNHRKIERLFDDLRRIRGR